MRKRGIVLAIVLLGVVATAAIVPFLIQESELKVETHTAFDESNKIFWATESAACEEYNREISQKAINLDNMTIKKLGSQGKEGASFNYNSFNVETQINSQKSLHSENACWVATGKSEGYDFSNEVNATYVKPGVEFSSNGIAYAWDKKGKLFEIKDGRLVPHSTINSPVWQCNHHLALCTDGTAKYLIDGSDLVSQGNAILVASTWDKSYFALDKNNKVKSTTNGGNFSNVKWKTTDKKTNKVSTGDLNVVFVTGGQKHMLALAEDGSLYGWGDNSKNQITQVPDGKDKTAKASYSTAEAVLITDKESVPNETSNTFVDLTPYKEEKNPIAAYLEDRYGDHPHSCSLHKEYKSGCIFCNRRNEHPWGSDSLADNCDCDLCKEIRDVTKYDARSKHLDKCHCDTCQQSCLRAGQSNSNSVRCSCSVCRTKRSHYWSCHCNACIKERGEFWGVDTVKSNEVPNPSTPLHVSEGTKLDNFQLMLDANSAYFSTNDFYHARVFGGEYRSVVEYRAKIIPKNPPETDNPNDVGTYKDGITSDSMDKIYVVDGGKVVRDETDFYDPLKKTWLVDFPAEIKKGKETIYELPAGDYEVVFESRFQIEKRGKFLWWATSEWEPVEGAISDWDRVAPFNMFWGVDTQKQTNNRNYYGGIFRMNDSLFNLTGGEAVSEQKHTIKAVAAGHTFSMVLAKNDSDSKNLPNKYKLLTWGENANKQLGRKKTDTRMSEVIFPGDDKKNDNYLAKDIVSIKAGSNQGLVLTSNGKLWTWGAGTFETPVEVSLNIDAPIVSIAAGEGENLLITENNSVYRWKSNTNSVTSDHLILN